MRQQINKGRTNYNPNSLAGGCPFQAMMKQGGFTHFAERIDAHKVRERSASFRDHFSQARLFFNSQSEPEKNHIVDAFRFELGKVETVAVRERMLTILWQIDKGLANGVAYGLGLSIPKVTEGTLNKSIPADGDPNQYESINKEGSLARSNALSMANTVKDSIETRKIAILAADGVNSASLTLMQEALTGAGAVVEVIAPRLGSITGEDGMDIPVKQSLLTAASVLYDAVYVAGGINSVATLAAEANAVHFLNEAFKHCKAIAAHDDAIQVLEETYFFSKLPEDRTDETVLREGIILGNDVSVIARQFMLAVAQHRFWDREKPRRVPA
jgi:catalase